MTDTPEQIELRRHLAEMRRAAHGVGKDFEIWFRTLDEKIDQMPHRTKEELGYFLEGIGDDFGALGRAVDAELASVPGRAANAGREIAAAAARVGGATRDAFQSAGKRSVTGTKNTFARLAGVKKTPMKEWRHPTPADPPEAR